MNNIKRIFVEKKTGFDVHSVKLLTEIQNQLAITGLVGMRAAQRYDIEGLDDAEFSAVSDTILSEPPTDVVYYECPRADHILAVEPLPGQYDQQADSAAQCIQLLTCKEQPIVKCSKIYLFYGVLSELEKKNITRYLINPLESREAALTMPDSLREIVQEPQDVEIISGFIEADKEALKRIRNDYGYVMSEADLAFCQNYFKSSEQRDPTATELKLIDTYWSDHCRHTTFNTELAEITLDNCDNNQPLVKALQSYYDCRTAVYNDVAYRPQTLMDVACIGAKKLRKDGLLANLEISDENNACSIIIDAKIDGHIEKVLLMFKNETHNHPTEIEPYGGAATCLGGAIRDPLSGRAYVFGSLRVTGAADPRRSVAETLEGKLPQRVITTNAASGFSAYGNQIGLATGKVAEIYHDGYTAKRMEVGAVIAAAKFDDVTRKPPLPGDLVILLGGDTGRDGIGGATGSSRAHDDSSLEKCGAEVQKGNPPTERKIQRLFRLQQASRMIKKCNDFGAGGVAVAIGELADSLDIDLALVPKKYDGLDGTELAVSESQERMAVVVAPEQAEEFIALANNENLKATVVANVTDSGRLIMRWRERKIVDISREFLDTNGVKLQIAAKMCDLPDSIDKLINKKCTLAELNETMSSLRGCLQKGLIERFDSTIGTSTVLLPFGGKHQLTPSEGLAMLLPFGSNSETAALMAHGFDVSLADVSPYHSAVYAVIESVSRIVAMGGDYRAVRLSFQEYFERLERDPKKWGKPLAALLGALTAQLELGTAAIGGKDSMSGSFKELSVPPTLIAFAVATVDAAKIVSNEFKQPGHNVFLVKTLRDRQGLPEWASLRATYELINKWQNNGEAVSVQSVKGNGVLHALAEMAVGNGIGVTIENAAVRFCKDSYYGDFIVETAGVLSADNVLLIGKTVCGKISIAGEKISVTQCATVMLEPLEQVFPTKSPAEAKPQCSKAAGLQSGAKLSGNQGAELFGTAVLNNSKFAKPRVFIPVFPGTNCEYDTAEAFNKAGAASEIFVFKNLNAAMVGQSITAMVEGIKHAQILMLPGGFSAADEPDGSGKFIAAILRNDQIKMQIEELLARNGLILGICNGFQALIKSGLLPFGKIHVQRPDDPTLTFNTIGRHVSTISRIKTASKLSPWLALANQEMVYNVPISHGEGRFVCSVALQEQLWQNGQIATRYVDLQGQVTMNEPDNPNGSLYAVEGLTSGDGRIFGKMGHCERVGKYLYKNLPGEYDMKIFEAGVKWFR
ncbi:MAG: phosphoribosylformylglycinamidine synthase [Negativicutes bacterium]